MGKKPDADFLRTVALHKAGERRSLALATVASILCVGLFLGFLWFKSPYYLASNAKPDDTILYAFGGGAFLLAATVFWLIARFERNRWEVYF